MKRRIALAIGTFAVLVSAFLLYDLASREGLPSRWRYRTKRPDLTEAPTSLPGVGWVVPGSGPEYIDYDEQGNKVARYTADAWKRLDREFHLTRPRVEWYFEAGQVAVIQADRGVVVPVVVGNRRRLASWRETSG